MAQFNLSQSGVLTMRHILIFLSCFLTMACTNVDIPQMMERYLWQKRVVILFTPDPQNLTYITQKKILAEHASGVDERDIAMIEVANFEFVALDGEVQPHVASKHFYKTYDVDPTEFTFILIGKDGEEKWRQSEIVKIDYLSGSSDSMPMRKREMKGR